MKRVFPFTLGVLVLLVLVGAVVAYEQAARVTAVFPADGAAVATGSVEIRITFSHPLTVQDVQKRVRFSPNVGGKWRVEGKTAVFTPNMPWRGGQTVTVEVAPPRGIANLPLGAVRRWQFHIAGTRLAYISPSVGIGNIFTIDPQTGKIAMLTHSNRVLDFASGFGGRYVYFSQQNFQHGSDIWRIDRLQSGEKSLKRLLVCGDQQCTSPTPDPTGTYLAYLRNDGFQQGTRVHVFNLNTGQDVALSSENGTSILPKWSSQGQLAYYDEGRRGYVIWQPDKGEIQFLANDTGEADAWSPDGHALLMVAMFLEGGGSEQSPADAPYLSAHLWLYRLSPTLRRIDLTRDPNLEDGTPSFSPDGSWIAFGRKYLDPQRWTLGRQFWLIKPDGSDARQITNEPNYNHLDFAWRPDSQAVAYQRTNMSLLTEPPEIWLYDMKTGESRLLVKDGVMPRWLP